MIASANVLNWVWRGCDTPNPVISRRSTPVQLFMRAVRPTNTVVALALPVGLRNPQETVMQIARITEGSGYRTDRVDGSRELHGALARTSACAGASNVVIAPFLSRTKL